jgi:spore maturation protein CgeB
MRRRRLPNCGPRRIIRCAGTRSTIDLVLTYGGGDPVVNAYRALGARDCIPVYNALDPMTHHPVAADARFSMPISVSRQPVAGPRGTRRALLPGAGGKASQRQLHARRLRLAGQADVANVDYIGHVSTRDHNAFNVTPKAVLNISRASMAENGFSPATRVFEAAGAGACLITDFWEGIELFLKPDEEVLVARDGKDVADILAGLSTERAQLIGRKALNRVLADHTYASRAVTVDAIFRAHAAQQMEAAE